MLSSSCCILFTTSFPIDPSELLLTIISGESKLQISGFNTQVEILSSIQLPQGIDINIMLPGLGKSLVRDVQSRISSALISYHYS